MDLWLAVTVISIVVGVTSVMFSLWVLSVDRHEKQHCQQIGELQHVLSLLADHIQDVSTAPLPEQVSAFASRDVLAMMRKMMGDDEDE